MMRPGGHLMNSRSRRPCSDVRLSVFLAVSTACSSGAVPMVPPDASLPVAVDASLDAIPADASPSCPCSPAETLSRDRILRSTSQNFQVGVLGRCERGEFLTTGSCVVDDFDPLMKLQVHGFSEYFTPSVDDRWVCEYRRNPAFRTLTATTVCLTDAGPTPTLPPDCMCPPVEALQERIFRSEQTDTLPVGSVTRVTASCPEDATLIAGSCVLPVTTSGIQDTNLVSIGFSRDMEGNDVWECAWNNRSMESLSSFVAAMCLRPPTAGTAPEAEPAADLIVKVEQRDTLPAGTSFTHEATCADGDYLLRGGCTLEDTEAASNGLSIFRAGFHPEAANTWQCGWNNPSTSTPTAIATALCLKPRSVTP